MRGDALVELLGERGYLVDRLPQLVSCALSRAGSATVLVFPGSGGAAVVPLAAAGGAKRSR
jgi:hypothetical protein